MTNNVNLVDEILSSIDEVETLTMESSVDVIGSMIDSYDKLFAIQENYTGDDIDGVLTSFYQEGQIMDEVKAKGANDGTIKKILMFLPRLLAAIVHVIKKAWNGGKSAKGAKSTLEKVKDAGSDAKSFIASVLSADSPEKLVGLVVGGITITAATAGVIFGIKKGIFEKLGNAAKPIIDKIKYFLHSKMTAGKVPTVADISKIQYDNLNDKWTLPVDLDAVIQFYTIPDDVLTAFSTINTGLLPVEKYEECINKFTKVRKLDIFVKPGKEYTSDALTSKIDEIDKAATAITKKANDAIDRTGKYSEIIKDSMSRYDHKIQKSLNDLVSEIRQYTEIVAAMTAYVNSLCDGINKMTNLLETSGMANTVNFTSDGKSDNTYDVNKLENIEKNTKLGEAIKDVKSQIAAANESAEDGKASKEEVKKIFEDVAAAHNVDVDDLKDAAKTPLKVKVSNAAAAGKEKAVNAVNAAADKAKHIAGEAKNKANGLVKSVTDKVNDLKKNKGKKPEPTTEFDVEDINDVDVVMFEYFVALDEAEVVQESVSNGWYSR